MLSESHPLIRRVIRFLLLPYCYMSLIDWSQCTRSRWQVALDFLYIFFRLKDYPDNYGACRLWERPRSQWPLYYGSNYNPYQRARLRRKVQPKEIEVIYHNKEVFNQLCTQVGIPVPKVIGTLAPDEDAREKLAGFLFSSGQDRLIVKPIAGNAGIGVTLAENTPNGVRIRDKHGATLPQDYTPRTECLVQEVLVQDPAIGRVAPGSVNTLRLMTMLTRSSNVITIGASMRFGVGTAVVDNWSAGGIAVGVDHRRGCLKSVGYDKKGNRYRRHPTSGIEFADFVVPAWAEAEDLGHRVQRALPFVKILGLDLAFTDDGVVVVEINSDADFVFQEQTSGPLLESFRTWKAFKEYDLLYNKYQRRLHLKR